MSLQECTSGLSCAVNTWNVIQVPISACCPLDRPHETYSYHPDVVAVAEPKLYSAEVPDHVILHIERHSLVLASILTSIAMTVLLVGTCLVSCTSRNDDYPHYEVVPSAGAEGDLFTTSCISQTTAVNCKDHLFPEPFRETNDKTKDLYT